MRRITMAALAALGLATAAAADPVEGRWRTQPADDGAYVTVNIASCGPQICGTIASVHGSPNTSVIGRRIIWDMAPRGDGSYRGGKIWAPDQDKTYNSKMTLRGDALRVEGCVLVVCRGQTWSRM